MTGEFEVETWVANPPIHDTDDPGYLDQLFIDHRDPYYSQRDGRPVLSSCGDDGRLTDASFREMCHLNPGITTPDEGMLATFGQVAGMTQTALAVGESVHGPRFSEAVDGFNGLFDNMVAFMNYDDGPYAVRPAAHSDRPKEHMARNRAVLQGPATDGVSSTFHARGDAPLGCAYGMNVGRVAHIISHDLNVQSVGIADIQRLLGNPSGHALELIQAYGVTADKLGVDYAVGRQRIIGSSVGVMVLKRLGQNDGHLRADQTGLIVNLDPHEISHTHDHYRADVAGTALQIRRAIRTITDSRYDLPAQALIEAQILDIAAVRSLLVAGDASGDHTPDPRRLAIGARGGNLDTALEEIVQIEGRQI